MFVRAVRTKAPSGSNSSFFTEESFEMKTSSSGFPISHDA